MEDFVKNIMMIKILITFKKYEDESEMLHEYFYKLIKE